MSSRFYYNYTNRVKVGRAADSGEAKGYFGEKIIYPIYLIKRAWRPIPLLTASVLLPFIRTFINSMECRGVYPHPFLGKVVLLAFTFDNLAEGFFPSDRTPGVNLEHTSTTVVSAKRLICNVSCN